MRPGGCWPSEGALSTASLELLESSGFDWVASGESVLRRSLAADAGTTAERACAHRLPRQHTACFFRDDGLSDLVGFTYSKWHGEDAAADFVRRLEAVADAGGDNTMRAVPVVLDGENAWEYYPFNGYYFLQAVYRKLADHPRLRLADVAERVLELTYTMCLAHRVRRLSA